VPYYFGYSFVSRQELINNTCDAAKKKLLNFVENQLVLIVDGTYVRHQKRQNNYFQRRVKKRRICAIPSHYALQTVLLFISLGLFMAP